MIEEKDLVKGACFLANSHSEEIKHHYWILITDVKGDIVEYDWLSVDHDIDESDNNKKTILSVVNNWNMVKSDISKFYEDLAYLLTISLKLDKDLIKKVLN